MKNKIEQLKEQLIDEMENYDPSEEFGISENKYQSIIERVHGFFDDIMDKEDESITIAKREKLQRIFSGKSSIQHCTKIIVG